MRFFLSLAVVAVAAAVVDAGPLRRSRAVSVSSCPGSSCQFAPATQWDGVQYVSAVAPQSCPGGVCPATLPAVILGEPAPAVAGDDALGEVNALRATRGLRPFLRDEGLTQAARACAAYRATNRLFGHSANDFQFLPPGISASAAGCAAYPASYGWLSCCTYEGYTYAGAAWAIGADGKRYMHLFVR